MITNGLEPVHMHKLGQIVILAGKNGAGKTRLLTLVKNIVRQKPHKTDIDNIKSVINRNNIQISSYKGNINHCTSTISTIKNLDETTIEFLSNSIKESENNIASCNIEINKQRELGKWSYVQTDKLSDDYSIIDFVPKQVSIQEIRQMNKVDFFAYAGFIDKVGVEQTHVGTYARIQQIQTRWWNATHQKTTLLQSEIDNAIEQYDRLNDLLYIFLGTRLGINIDGDATIFGFPLSNYHLSDGQKILLQFCIAIHCQEKSLDELILFMDEPENHLHPSVIIEIIDRLRSHTSKGQIWISTHSVPLISYFDPSCIWYMDKNKVSYAGNIPEVVLKGLLGDEDRIAKLQDFTNLPGILALNRHAFESLFHPNAVTTDKSDPQPLQIREEIKKHLKDGTKIKVLDYGAGKGRLLSNIIENNTEAIETFNKWFDYVAYDKFDSDKNDCLAALERVYPDYQDRYFNNFSDLFSKHDKESFDVVILCNVLHEVDPLDWIKTFGSNGDVTNLLNDNGIALIVEDHAMPIGEKAYQKGFIVLNTSDLKDLFSASSAEIEFSDAKNDGRLKAHRIPKQCLLRITPESRIKALQAVNKTAREEILKIREASVTYKNGKTHGYWIQQLANTTLALIELGEPIK